MVSPEKRFFLKFRRVTIRGAQPSARLCEEIRLSEGSQGPLRGSLRGFCRGLRGALRGFAGVRGIFRGSDPVLVTLENRRRAPDVHQQMCTTRRPFQRLGGLLSNHPDQNQKNNKLSNEKVPLPKNFCNFFALFRSEMQQFPGKAQKCKIFHGPFLQIGKLTWHQH